MDPGVKWCRMKIGNTAYMHAVPWVAIILLLIRSFLERQVLYSKTYCKLIVVL